MFKNPFSFEGRIRRTEFGLSYIIYLVATVFVNALAASISPFLFVCYIPMLWFFFAQGTKRCHDRGNSGWYIFIPFYVLWLIFADGEPEENYYGEDPKGRSNLVEQLFAESEQENVAV